MKKSDSSSDKEQNAFMCNILGNMFIDHHSINSKKNNWCEESWAYDRQ